MNNRKEMVFEDINKIKCEQYAGEWNCKITRNIETKSYLGWEKSIQKKRERVAGIIKHAKNIIFSSTHLLNVSNITLDKNIFEIKGYPNTTIKKIKISYEEGK